MAKPYRSVAWLLLPVCATLIAGLRLMAEPGGPSVPSRSQSHGSAGAAARDARGDRYRLGEELFQHGLVRGEKHARAGLDYSAAMSKYVGTVPFYGFGGVDLDLDARGRQLLDRVYAAPPHLHRAYYEAFLAGYKLGHVLNLPKERQTLLASLDHLIRIGYALVSYSQEGNGRLPSMNDVPALRRALGALVKADDFVNPITGEPYKLNSSLSHRKWLDLKVHSKRLVAVYEATAAPDGSRGIVFITGEACRVPEREWVRLREAAHIR